MKLWVSDDEFGEDFQVEVPVASVVAALIAKGGEEVMVEFDMKTRCYVVSGAALDDGVHLVFPIPVESAEAKET